MMEAPQNPPSPIQSHFHLCVPCLTAKSVGAVPTITYKDSFRTLERKRHRLVQINENHVSAKISLSVSVNGTNTLLISPPFLDLIGSITKSVEIFFKGRSAISVLNWVSHSAGVNTSSSLSRVSESSQAGEEVNTPILHVCVNMNHGAYLAVQLIQSATSIKQHSIPENLNKISAHKSLLTFYVSGLDCNSLLQTSLEFDSLPHLKVKDKTSKDQKSSLSKIRVGSWKISLEVKCPVLQADLSVLVPETEADEYTELPGLIHGQKQLNFNLTLPIIQNHTQFILCDLVEVGAKDATLSCAAHIAQSEVREEVWDNLTALETYENPEREEVKCNQVGIKVSFPCVWSQLSAPPCGLPSPTSSGLDCLVLQDAAKVWYRSGKKLMESIMTMLNTKSSREKQMLLTLVCNAARSYPQGKPLNSVLSEVPQLYRKTVLFCCLYQVWEALPVFSEIHVPTTALPIANVDSQLVAVMLALAVKLYSLQGKKIEKKPTPPTISLGDPDQSSDVTVGYISISPSPSDMAMPNRLHANRKYLEEEEEEEEEELDFNPFSQVDYNVLTFLRESLNPFFSASGVKLEQKLGVPYINSAQFSINFTVEVKEATLFVLEHLKENPSTFHTNLVTSNPVLLAEQVLVSGYVKRNAELEASMSVSKPTLLPRQGGSPVPPLQAKVRIVSNCCVAMDNIHSTITVPLLKLVKHLNVTGKLRRKAFNQTKMDAMDAAVTPIPPPPPGPPVLTEIGHISKYASSIISHLSVLEDEAVHIQDNLPLMSTGSNLAMSEGIHTNSPHRPSLSRIYPPDDGLTSLRRQSTYSSSSVSSSPDISHSVVIAMEGTSPEDGISPMDTCGDDTTDSQPIFSSDNEGHDPSLHSHNRPPPPPPPSFGSAPPIQEPTQSPVSLPKTNLFFTIFGLLKLGSVKCELQIETTRVLLELEKISTSIDTRDSASKKDLAKMSVHLPFFFQHLPTYLSMATTVKQAKLRVYDRGLPDYDILQLVIMPIYASIGMNNCPPLIPTYRCLLKLSSLQVDIKQSAVKVHKRFQKLMPSFTRMYQEIFGIEVGVISKSEFTSTSEQILRMDSVMKLPSMIPQGFIHLSLDKAVIHVAPLPSLSVTYAVSPLSVKAQTVQMISFQLVVGEHVLRFNPKEQYKNELSLRSLTLPCLQLHGKVQSSRKKEIPRVTLDLSMKQINIDLTTDVLNQLLIVQNTFIKELNELLQMLTSIGESIPYKEHQRESIPCKERQPPVVSGEGLNLVTLLESCHIILGGVVITISTPLATAIRFSTGKIEMTLTNTSAQNWPWKTLPASAKNQLSLDGRVEIAINLSLGYLQDVGPDVVEDLCELAYFRTRISVRNTLQNLPGKSDSTEDTDNTVDTFLISILSPHLYLQSSAVEQAILFWLNCKSVYSYWQNERKLLNIEVRRATEALLEKFQRPTQFQTPSIDFSKPRLVQITVTDLGTCMPIIPVSSSHHNIQKSFPALVVTIKEMQFLLNLSHKVASTGRFQTFCVRYAEQFSLRHKIWTLDLKKHKLTNYGTITRGTFRLCLATTKRVSEKEPDVALGDKLLCGFQWDMSGINVHTNTDIGHHTSTLVRTMTTISSDTESRGKYKKYGRSSSVQPSPKSQSSRLIRKTSGVTKSMHKRSQSLYRPSQADTNYKMALEQELAKQTRKVQRLRYSGATGDSLRTEEDILRNTEEELAKTVQRIFRHPRTGISLQKFNQIFSPWPVSSHERISRHFSTAVKRKFFSISDKTPEENEVSKSGSSSPVHVPSPSPRQKRSLAGHRRYKSDLTGMMGGVLTATPFPEEDKEGGGEEEEEEEEEMVFSDRDVGMSATSQETEGFSIPSIDIEFNVAISVDHGKVVLRTEEHSTDKQLSHSSLLSHGSLLQSHNIKADHKHFVESVLLIPALTVKTHYQSLVGPSYSNRMNSSFHSSSSPIKQTVSAPAVQTIPPSHQTLPSLPVKRGVLSLSAVIESLPEDIKVTHSVLEFIEQVARPTLAATVISSSSSSESLSEEDGIPEDKATVATPAPISFPVDVTLTFHIQPSTVHLTCQPHSKVECIIQSPDVNFVISFSLFGHQTLERPHPHVTPSPTSSTIDPNSRAVAFNNLYITGCLTTFLLQLYSPQVSSLKQGGTIVENKEALSLTLGQALLHFSRKSVLAPIFHKGGGKPAATSVDDYDTHKKMQVSVIINIASVVLGYDMRRLNDVTAFRRWWYRTSLVEALFIGSKKPPEDKGSSISQVPESSDESTTASAVANLDNTISAAIVVAATVDDFRVAANFAQVMGNADLLITYLNCEAHCDVSHNELVLLQLDCNLKKGEFDARAGVIAGCILMENTALHVLTQSHQGSTPDHRGKAVIKLVEGRVDYMSSCIALARATYLNVEGCDIWKGLHLNGVNEDGESELASIQVEAHFSWKELQLAIHRSTTKDFFNIAEKMYEFVMQQKRRSERTLSNMLPAGSAASKALEAYRKEQQMAEKDSTAIKGATRHHWLWAIRVGSIELMDILGIQPPKDAQHEVSLGGNISIFGDNICIVCFHGPSFREKERVIFNIDQVEASFSTQAIPGLGRWQTEVGHDPMQTHIRTCQQIVLLKLGDGSGAKTTDLVTIHRVSVERARVPNISGNTVRDWLAYACIDTFLHPDKYVSDNSTLVRISRKLSVQSVLLVPAFRVELINDHFWPLVTTMVPRVECTLTSFFSEGISVTTTVDHYLFLHDVVKGYVDYLDIHRLRATVDLSTEHSSSTADEPVQSSEVVKRHYECVCWELDPHLRLMSAVSGQFNPHFSWLLEKLGFVNPRTTIPKWIQRGAMDPLDKVVATGVELLVKVTATKKKNLISTPSHQT